MKRGQANLIDFDEDLLIFRKIEGGFPLKESHEIEFKSAQDGFPKEFWKTYSAFANTNNGIIVLGILEKRNSFQIIGLTDDQIEKYIKYFWNNCNNPNTVNRNLITNKDVKVIAVNGKNVLAFRIPFANRTERPVYITRNPFGNTYKRNYEGDYRCSDDEVKRMLADSSAELKKDSKILENYTIADLDLNSIKQFRQLFMSSRSGHPWHALDDMSLLKKLGAYRIDRKTGTEGITLAGLLMFGKEDSLKEQEALPDYFPDFREHLSTNKKIRWTDRIYPDGTWECNLLQFYLKVWSKLSSTLPKPFLLNKDERIDETPAHIALREAFINSIVHADYSLNGNIIVELNTDEFIFSNPGTLLVSLEQYYAGGISECRNPALQQMFMLIGRAEKAGSGVDKIMSGWKDSHWRKPFIVLESQPDRVKLTLPMFSVIPDSVLNELKSFFDDVGILSSDELTILSFCLMEGSISNHRLQYILNMHSVDITTMLKRLCEAGYLDSDNNGRWTIYKIRQKVDTSNTNVDTSGEKVDTSNSRIADSTHIVDNQKIKNDNNTIIITNSEQKIDTSNTKVDTYIYKPTRSYLSREELEKLIMQVCLHNYKKMDEVAKIIDKSIDYLKNKIFPQMIIEGKLEKRFPYTHNHPEQGYKTTEKYAKEL